MALINNLGMLGVLYIRLAKYDAAERVSKDALTRIKAIPNRTPVQYQYGEAVVSGNLGTIAARHGEYTDALHYFDRAVELFEKLDMQIGGYESSALDNLIGIGGVHFDSRQL